MVHSATLILSTFATVFRLQIIWLSCVYPSSVKAATPRPLTRALFGNGNGSHSLSDLPSQCQDVCEDFINILNQNQADPSTCTDSHSDQFATCLNCDVQFGHDSQSSAQSVMNGYVMGCKVINTPVKNQTIHPVAPSSSSGTSTLTSGSSTATLTSPTSPSGNNNPPQTGSAELSISNTGMIAGSIATVLALL